MASTHTLTGNVYDLTGATLGATGVRVTVVTNLPAKSALIDKTTNSIHLGGKNATLDPSTGLFSIELIDTSATDLNVAANTLEYEVRAEYVNPATRVRSTWTSGWFPFTADANLADITTDVEPLAVESASAFAQDAAESAALARSISEIDTTDAAIKTTLELPGSESGGYLAATFVRGAAEDGAGTYTDGNVIRIGDHAYTPAGIATAAVIGGATNYENVIGGNPANVNTATSNLTGAAALTGENGNWSFIHGGYDNVVNGWACSVMGFHCKVIAGANHITVSGGSLHTVNADAAYGTIGGGTGHTVSASSSGATIGGGRTNTASGQDSTVAGGQQNQATANSSTVAGGLQNTATNQSATVGGGFDNDATGNSSTVSGGLSNVASATGATVTGGRENTAAGEYSRAGGRGAVASNAGEDVFASTAFATAGDAQAIRIVLKRQTTNATASDLHNPGSLPPTIPENTTWAFTALVVARRTDVDGENAAWEVKGLYKRDAGNTAALVGTPTVTSLGANAGNTWTLAVASYSVGNLRFVVTGEAAKTIRWVANTQLVAAAG